MQLEHVTKQKNSWFYQKIEDDGWWHNITVGLLSVLGISTFKYSNFA